MKVTLAAPYTDANGNNHNADKSANLPYSEASNLLHLGLARPYVQKTRRTNTPQKPIEEADDTVTSDDLSGEETILNG